MLGPVGAYAALVFLAFWTTIVAAYGAARHLDIGVIGSALAATLFTLTPVHMVEAQLHVALAFVFPLPLLLVLGIRAIELPSRRRGAFLGIGLALCGATSPLISFLEAAALALGLTVAAFIVGVKRPERRGSLATAGTSALGAAALALGTLAFLLVVYRGGFAAVGLDRSISDVGTFSLPLSAYLDPNTTPVGFVGLTLALAGLVAARLSGIRRLTLGLTGLMGMLFSLRPELSVIGVDVSMPSKVVHSIIPYWRVFGRVAVVMALSGSILAGAFIDRLAAGRRWLPRLAAVAIAVIALAEIAQRPPRPAGDLGRPDRLADILRDSQGGVAEYPLFGFDNYQLGPYLIRQLRHGRPLLNGSIEGTTAADLAWAAKTANAPEAQEALTLAGVLTAVVHPGSPQPNATGFRRSTRLPDGTSVYAVAGVTNAVVASLRGAYAEETGPDGSPFQWLAPRAAVRVIAEGHGAATLTFDAVSPEIPRTVRFGTSRRAISTAPTPVRLCVRFADDRTATIPIRTEPAPRNLPGGDTRVSGIGIYHLRAEPGCG